MADVNIDKFRVSTVRPNTQPANSGNVTTEPQVPVNPPGSGGTTFGGAGAGLSIDGVGKIQLGNDGAGVVDVIDSTVFPNGFLVKAEEIVSGSTYYANMYLANGDTYLQTAELNPVTGYNKAASLFSVPNASTISFNFTSGSPSNSGWAQLQNRLTTGFNPLVDDLESVHNIYDEVYNTGTGLSIVRNAITGVYTIKIFDERGQKGLVNDGDYEANFTARSLVTKQYVDGAISGAGHNPVTIGSPANGLSISGTQVLSLGLASAGVTGALSGTDWSTFNGKLNLTSPITGYTVGANTALADTDTILQAFGKVQGQINARVSGSGTLNFVPKFTASGTIGNSLIFENGQDVLIGTTSQVLNFGRELTVSNTSGADPESFVVVQGSRSAGIANVGGFVFYNGASQIASIAGAMNNVTNSGLMRFFLANAGAITERMRLTNTGELWVNTTSGTNTLDVNGTARIRTISNLGTAATSVLVPSATGVVSLRTLAELASDGLGSKWTDVAGGIFRNGAVAIGRTTIPTSNLLTLRQTTNDDTVTSLRCERLDGTVRMEVRNTYSQFFHSVALEGATTGIVTLRVRQRTSDDTVSSLVCENSAGTLRFRVTNSFSEFAHQVGIVGSSTDLQALRVRSGNTGQIFIGQDNLGNNVFTIANSGMVTSRGLTITDAFNIVFGTTTGTRIGTATNQRLAFYNSTPIVQPSGDILTALSNLGLVATPSITPIDQLAVKTTASADQTLPSGTLTILDYDTTVINNSTPTYTVGTDGRITINTTGIYTITAGVVVEANAVTALESAFLGIFRNGDLVAISSINTTIAAGAQSGLTTSTILSLTATDIIDCRALVNSVGGVANGLARRLGTLLGANATQVNSLSITKNSQ